MTRERAVSFLLFFCNSRRSRSTSIFFSSSAFAAAWALSSFVEERGRERWRKKRKNAPLGTKTHFSFSFSRRGPARRTQQSIAQVSKEKERRDTRGWRLRNDIAERKTTAQKKTMSRE